MDNDFPAPGPGKEDVTRYYRVPAIGSSLIGELTPDDPPALMKARTVLRDTSSALQKAVDAEPRIMEDPTATPAARKLRMAKLIDQAEQKGRKAIEEAYEGLVSEAEARTRALDVSIRPDSSEREYGPEVRRHFAQLDDEGRARLLNKLRKAGDTTSLRLLAAGPAYLSGLSPSQQNAIRADLYDPDERAQVQRMTDAADHLSSSLRALSKLRQHYMTDDVLALIEAAKAAAA